MAEHGEPRDKRRDPFAMVGVSILRDPTITPQCKALFGVLISYGPDHIFPSHETLAKCLGVKRRSIARWLQELREHGLIGWVQTGRSNRYRIIEPRCAPEHTSDVHSETHQMCAPEQIGCAPEDTRSRSMYPDPSIQRDMAATAAPTSPSTALPSPNETDGNGTEPPSRSKQKAKGKTPPAVAAFRRATHRYPPKSWYSNIVQAVGDDEADLVFWHDVCKAYVGQGWNPLNAQVMLEYYGRREIPGGGGRPAGSSKGRRSAGQRRGEAAHYEPCTVEERQEVWAKHGDWVRAFVSAKKEWMRQTGYSNYHINPHVIKSAAMKELGLSKRKAQALVEAYDIETEEPLDATTFFEDSS